MTESPYGKYVKGEDVLECLEETPRRVERAVHGWGAETFERSDAPGKWSARQLLVHLAQMEIVFASRLRFALATNAYVVQPFDQDDWMRSEPEATADAALGAYLTLRRMNVALCRTLTRAERTRQILHPEYGAIDIEWIMTTVAGHDRHHLPQFETIGAAAR